MLCSYKWYKYRLVSSDIWPEARGLLSLLLFNMYLNDLVHDLKSVAEGIDMND